MKFTNDDIKKLRENIDVGVYKHNAKALKKIAG